MRSKIVIDTNKPYFTEQIITYIGNKRSLLKEINEMICYVKEKTGKKKIVSSDLFSGSGVVSRLLKEHSSLIIANDLELYSKIINECFLSNSSDFDSKEFNEYLKVIQTKINEQPVTGVISKNYAPKDDESIKAGERAFYTHRNALYIDSFRYYIDEVVPDSYKKYFLALLVTEASIHVNTSGVFKGFYKDKNTGIGKFGGTAENALSRIKGDIVIKKPYFSKNECEYRIFQEDTIALSKKLPHMDLVYLDPPYNQHPYGSNYFMLNLVINNEEPHEVSRVSGIPKNWNHSPFNRKNDALKSMDSIISNLNADYILISYNNEGFISYQEMENMLNKYGKVSCKEIVYNTFRGSRNLRERDIHTNEFLFLLEKGV
jgi:adenine-specific DNA-methyltransferase